MRKGGLHRTMVQSTGYSSERSLSLGLASCNAAACWLVVVQGWCILISVTLTVYMKPQ